MHTTTRNHALALLIVLTCFAPLYSATKVRSLVNLTTIIATLTRYM